MVVDKEVLKAKVMGMELMMLQQHMDKKNKALEMVVTENLGVGKFDGAR